MVCSSCGRENNADARFCGACGAELDAELSDAETRRVVTIVFTDVAGSTALGERLDPESLRRVMWRYFETMQETLERYGGTVEKFIGDAIVAVFGVPAVHEDDALRAVRAAFEMSEALKRVNEDLARERGVRIATRTAINTGEVIVGDTATDQKLATGDAVNVAARLEQAAQPGEVLLGEATYRLVADAAVVEAAPAVEAKGKSHPLAAWRLLGLRPDVPAFARPIAAPFVGRGRELDELRLAFDTAVRESACSLATIAGPPGIGKSRLARELVRSLEKDARVVVGRCIAYGEGITYLPLAEVVREVAGADPEPALARLLTNVERGPIATQRIAGAIGARDEAGSPEETAWAFRRLFETLAASRPLIIVVDDIHWAEPTLLDLLEYVLGFSSGAPILLLCLARPDLFDVRPSWAAPRPRATLVSLSPLTDNESEDLIDGLMHEGDVAAGLRDRIVGAAEGNPLFVEQMLAMLADDPHAADEAVPATIHALLAARIDRLEPGERTVLQRASVEGRLFHRGAVAELLSPHAADGLGGILLALTRKELLRPDRSLFEGDDAFRFNHVLIRDVAYASLPKELRADLHARLASWLEAHAGAQVTGQDEIVGYHLEQAYLNRAELGRIDAEARALALKGGQLLGHAGRRALDRDEFAVAASLVERACRLLAIEPAERAALLTDLGRALRGTGALDAADAALAEAIEDATRHGDEATELRAEMERAHVAFMRAPPEPDALRVIARRAIAVFEPIGSDADLADAWQLMGMAELAARDRGAQLVALQRGRRHALASGDTRRQIESWNELGGAMLFGRTPVDDVLPFLDEELAWARERGLPAVEADALLGGPYLYARLGRFDEARDQLARSKAICRELGIAYGLAEAHMAGAEMEMLAGDAEAAERELREAIRVTTDMGALHYVSLYRTRIAHVLVAQGRDDDALAELEQARQHIHGEAPSWKAARARVLARRGETEEAVTLAGEAVASMARTGDITKHAETLVDLAEVLRAHGDLVGAGDALTEAVALHEEKGNVLPAERCRQLLATFAAGGRPATKL
ncbi:MAG: zinc-ribbon domain-containing protein [Actinobacteria bacterium]|nr:MAG: zinc-ribbon domain-containing protein [Actinomycetota bacterium]